MTDNNDKESASKVTINIIESDIKQKGPGKMKIVELRIQKIKENIIIKSRSDTITQQENDIDLNNKFSTITLLKNDIGKDHRET